jgi:hypothetical protein
MTSPALVSGPPLIVADGASLSAAPSGTLLQGSMAFVQSLGAYFSLQPSDVETPNGVTILAALGGGNWIRALQGTVQAVNAVSSSNASALPAANPLVFTSAPISRQGSGIVEVSGSGCPILSGGGGTVITFGITRDFGTGSAVQLGTGGAPIARKILPAGAGQDAEGAITPFLDTLPDFLPHTYSLVMSTASTTMSDNAGHVVLTAKEL